MPEASFTSLAVLLQATSLSFIVAAMDIGLAIGAVTQATAAAFIAAGLLSALVFPIVALGVLRSAEPADELMSAAMPPTGAVPK